MSYYSDLRAEIQTDPNGLGYAGKSDNDAAALINLQDGVTVVSITSLTSAQLCDCINPNEFGNLSASNKQYVQQVLSMGSINTQGNTMTALITMFAPGSNTKNNLINAATKFGSRGETLFGAGALVQASDIRIAMGRG